MQKYDPQKIEKKWQKIWQEKNADKAEDFSKNPKYYCLDMFPYPSGEGLHVGHLRGYTFSDVWARYQRLLGKNVLHPIGWDAFGLPAENAAIKNNSHPAEYTKNSIKKFKEQLGEIGYSYDWSREINSSEPDYYKWTQWLFLKLYQAGLAYKKKAPVNWCPSCQTVLANEQVNGGFCERCESQVEKKNLEQWFFKITKYADELLNDLNKLDWPERTKTLQKNWLGKSKGAKVKFQIDGSKDYIEVFTTRPDTLFGATFMVLAPEHPLLKTLVTQDNFAQASSYIEKAPKESDIDRESVEREKTGVFIGSYAINPVNNKKIPIWISDYVLMSYGTGACVCVPAHDARDFEFAKKFDIPIIEVISPDGKSHKLTQAYTESGKMVNSGKYNDMDNLAGGKKIVADLGGKIAKPHISWNLRDWLISRQRYWGAPIPIIYCDQCGPQPVPEKDLPVKLPKVSDFKPKGTSPLATSKEFVNTKCPKCGGPAHRETDTMDTFVCSSWYYLRYTDPHNDKLFATSDKLKYWCPVDFCIGGIEHATMHLLYVRFFAKALADLKLINFREPFTKLYNIGMIYLHGAKMSKSKSNVVNPDEIILDFGADAMRGYELFIGPADQDSEWNPNGIAGVRRFLDKVWQIALSAKTNKSDKDPIFHQYLKKISESLEAFRTNVLVSDLMELATHLQKKNENSQQNIESFLIMISPVYPHIAEEQWQKLGHKDSIFNQTWPKYDQSLAKKTELTIVIQVNGKFRDKIIIASEDAKNQQKISKISQEQKNIKKNIHKKKIIKTIYVPGKLINFVIK